MASKYSGHITSIDKIRITIVQKVINPHNPSADIWYVT